MQLIAALIVLFCFMAFVWGVWLLLSGLTSSCQRIFQSKSSYPTMTAMDMVTELQSIPVQDAVFSERSEGSSPPADQLQRMLKTLQDLQQMMKEGGLSKAEYELLKAHLIQEMTATKTAA